LLGFCIFRLCKQVDIYAFLILALPCTLSIIFLAFLVGSLDLLRDFDAFKTEILVKDFTIKLFLHDNYRFMAATTSLYIGTYIVQVELKETI